MTFGEKLSKLRKEYNYTQEQLADLLEVSRQSVSKWESDLAYPETDKLIRLGKLFDCSMDYLLKEEIVDRNGTVQEDKVPFWESFKKQFHERKSEKTVWGMPLYHIGKNAQGFFAIGWKAKGVFSIGLMSRGVFSLGLLSFGILSIGLLSLGLIALGILALGLIGAGSIAMGLLAAGAISVGIVSFGAVSVGCFSAGALAIGKYVAIGDHARGMIAIGESETVGSAFEYAVSLYRSELPMIRGWLDAHVPAWLSWAKELFWLYLC